MSSKTLAAVGRDGIPTPASKSRIVDMDSTQLREMLESLRDGQLPVELAIEKLQVSHSGAEGPPAVADLGYANVDLHRQRRCGYPEVIFCEGKTAEWVEGIARKLIEAGQNCLATRVNDEQARLLERSFPKAEQDRLARTFWYPVDPQADPVGKVVVITAGTSDLPVGREALVTASALGADVSLLADVGVAGLHRLLRHSETFEEADVIIVVAGMEGALPSVVGGLVDCPVIAVPTSVGYGAAFGGLAALLGMLNSCSSNVVVVNIDSGFKGGYVAALMARKMGQS